MVAQFVAEFAEQNTCNFQGRVFKPEPEHEFRRRVGANLQGMRVSVNLTLTKLSELSGYSRDKVWKLENARDGSAKSDRVYNIAVVLFCRACEQEQRICQAVDGYRQPRWTPTQASFDDFLTYIYTHREG